MKDDLQPNRCARLLAALAAPERLRIIQVLRQGPLTVGDIARAIGMTVVNVSHHLSVLRHAQLVMREKQGRFKVYSLSASVFHPGPASAVECLDLGCCRLEFP